MPLGPTLACPPRALSLRLVLFPAPRTSLPAADREALATALEALAGELA
jgi:hypothetical protein